MLKQKRRFTDEQIASANSVNILDYARNTGYELKKMSRNSLKIPKYGGLYIHSNVRYGIGLPEIKVEE